MTGDPQPLSSKSMPYPPGTVLAGKYRVEQMLGEGGMGWVVVAMHLQLEQRVALKFMRATLAAEQPDAVARFLREGRAAARIQSDYVARVSDVGTLDDGAPYLVMEYLEGHDLEVELRDTPRLPVLQAVDYALQACEGLAEAHTSGIVHRDLKPANLFLARKSDGSVRLKLLDFGISKLPAGSGSSTGSMTSTQALMGSPLYMSPEQLRSSKNVDPRADVWSMGVILYEMLAGVAPFEAETLPEVCARVMAVAPPPLETLRPDLPEGLVNAVMRCLEKEVDRRLPNVSALAEALAPFGGPDAHSAAQRVGRVVRSHEPRPSSPRADASGPIAPVAPTGAKARSESALTSASFETLGIPAAARRSPAMPLALGAATLALVAAAVFGIVATRGPREPPVQAAAGHWGPAAVPAAREVPFGRGSVEAQHEAALAPPADRAPTAPDEVRDAEAPRAPRVVQGPNAPAAGKSAPGGGARPRPRPAATPGSPSPLGTSAFGGRE